MPLNAVMLMKQAGMAEEAEAAASEAAPLQCVRAPACASPQLLQPPMCQPCPRLARQQEETLGCSATKAGRDPARK